jgi:hypothetical protein
MGDEEQEDLNTHRVKIRFVVIGYPLFVIRVKNKVPQYDLQAGPGTFTGT